MPGRPSGLAEPWEACDKLPDHVLPTVPHRPAIALLLAIILLGGLVVSRRNEGATGPPRECGASKIPFWSSRAVYLGAYFAFPENGLGVEILSPRFSIQAAMAAVFAWNLPPRAWRARACWPPWPHSGGGV